MTSIDKEDVLGVGACKNVFVSVSQKSGDNRYWITFRLASEFLPAEFEFQIDSLEYLTAILEFLDTHIGSDQEGSYTCAATSDSRIRISNEPEALDRFSFFLSAPGVIVTQVFGGVSSASLLKALVMAVGEVSSGIQTSEQGVDLNT